MPTPSLDHYFRLEAAELLADLTRGLLDLEKEPGRTELLGQCFRFAHTLKGAARTARKPHVGELAHAIEDTLAQHRETGEPIERAHITDLLAILDTIRLEIGDAPQKLISTSTGDKPHEQRMASEDERLKTVRVDIASMEELFDDVSEIAVQLFPLRAGVDELKSALDTATSTTKRIRVEEDADIQAGFALETLNDLQTRLKSAHHDISSSLERLERNLARARDVTAALRLVQVNTIIDPLELAARDAAEALGKDINFEVDGGTVRIEVQLLAAVRDALLHVIRNAVDHGIEKPLERIAAGKPKSGQIRLEIEHKGRRVLFRVHDDGRGVDEEAVRRAAIRYGAVDAAQAQQLSSVEALRLAFRAGVSTRETITGVSGRGVGLDVVRELANRLRGDVDIQSEKGHGTTLTLELPITLTSLLVLSVALAGESFLIPLDGVRGTRLVTAAEITESPGGLRVLHEGRVVPFVSLARVLGRPMAAEKKAQCVIALVKSGDRITAFEIDRVQGVFEVMVKPLPTSAGTPLLVVGAAFDPRGDPLLVLDPRGLVETALGLPSETRKSSIPRKLPILIIDDSLTTRMLEKSILESAGYEVDQAASAEEALEMAARRRYGLFVVDIEMPGMNGFEFTARTRADLAFKMIPVMIVTSLASETERHRGFEVGASAYLVKGDFDQKRFVEEVAELLGGDHG